MKSKSTLAFLTAGAAAAAVVTALTIKRQPSKQPSPRSTLIYPTRTYNRCMGSFNTTATTTTTKKNDNTFYILKDPTHPSHDTTSFVSYNLPPGQTYQLGFELRSSRPITNSKTKTRLLSTGSQTLDIFSTVGSPPTPSRDCHLARVVVREGGAEWVDGGHAPVFEARESEPVVLEFVGVGDAVEVCWGDVDVDVGFFMRDITS